MGATRLERVQQVLAFAAAHHAERARRCGGPLPAPIAAPALAAEVVRRVVKCGLGVMEGTSGANFYDEVSSAGQVGLRWRDGGERDRESCRGRGLPCLRLQGVWPAARPFALAPSDG